MKKRATKYGPATASSPLPIRMLPTVSDASIWEPVIPAAQGHSAIGWSTRSSPTLCSTNLRATGTWPIKSLRQAFLDGSLERLINPDEYLRRKVPEFVARGDFGLASGYQP